MIHYTFISNILQHILFFNNRIFIKRSTKSFHDSQIILQNRSAYSCAISTSSPLKKKRKSSNIFQSRVKKFETKLNDLSGANSESC